MLSLLPEVRERILREVPETEHGREPMPPWRRHSAAGIAEMFIAVALITEPFPLLNKPPIPPFAAGAGLLDTPKKPNAAKHPA